jgi:uncharacterized protein (TIGR00288 family)
MTTPFSRAPHQGDPVGSAAPNAALLIDFDNVTMGMRSDLSRDLRKLLQSDVIRGKVTVQRAYADWRRYPQYIVPLSENSIDLIFAPAYGSSKKNATDIRMAIDAMELVFVRPEIGTFILLTGDSDFSSAVLKLKEYGKYVIGVGIQESSSDILVQNCDEYYSYTSLTGLQKTTGGDQKAIDPWVLVEKAIRTMADRNDVMRSDRLKQVMIELDPSFDEGSYGFSKFSRFITEAASKNLVHLRKMENGQYEVAPGGGGGGGGERGSRRQERSDESRGRGRGRGRRDERGGERKEARKSNGRRDAPAREASPDRVAASSGSPPGTDEAAGGAAGDPLQAAYDLLRRSLEALRRDDRHPARDSDVKRRMLELDEHFDEAELGFSKFSRFLRQADDHEVVRLQREQGGNYEVSLREGPDGAHEVVGADEAPRRGARPYDEGGNESGEPDTAGAEERAGPGDQAEERAARTASDAAPADRSRPVVRELRPEDVVDAAAPGRRLGPRGGTTRRRSGEEAPPSLFEGQTAESSYRTGEGPDRSHGAGPASRGPVDDRARGGEAPVDPSTLGLPTDPDAQVRYLSNSYKGVGKKTAEVLVEEFGESLFTVLDEQPDRVREVVPPGRADRVLEAWQEDLTRRREPGEGGDDRGRSGGGGGGRRGRRGRGSRGGSQ